jgi:hypothetical protein
MAGSRAAGKRRLRRVVQRGRRSDLFPKVSRGGRKESQRTGCAHTSRGRRGAVKQVQQRAELKIHCRLVMKKRWQQSTVVLVEAG